MVCAASSGGGVRKWTERFIRLLGVNYERGRMKGGMGFLNLGVFNQALLAKQCWKLVSKPNSLAAMVLNGSYFPDSNFIIYLPKINDDMVYVSQLRSVTGNWNMTLMEDMFLNDDARQILKIPNSVTREDDRLCWHYTTDDIYTFKSRYQSPNVVEGRCRTDVYIRDIKWKPPEEGFYKINRDAALNMGDQLVGIGIVIRDCLVPYVAQTDALGVVIKVKSGEPIASDVGLVVDEITDYLRNDTRGTVVFVSREANFVAHTLSK
ncbi:hypothetical protein Dsin_015628 [Dipteronia sinensis]|uniref:RNase H type-1 domain-containing protein n=1 Tax=Dipteronia sinensis TaxID=43782 RepID=A0AAE0E4Y2_9ROSI|nr:hypothetical protein Dsin_015628 [Dipteronia sinensis]